METTEKGKEPNLLKRNVENSVLDKFWLLAEPDRQKRIGSAYGLLLSITEKQQQHQEQGLCSDLDYSIQRLVRGIGSSRKCARQGFYVALTEILRTVDAVTVEYVLKLMSDHLPLSGSKQEKGNAVIGQMLAYGSLVRSGRVATDGLSVEKMFTAMWNLSRKRHYLQQMCFRFLEELFKQVDESIFRNHIWAQLRDKLGRGWESCTPDTLCLLLMCHKHFPNVVTSKFLKKHWGSEEIVSKNSLHHISKLVKQSTVVHPQVHPLCSELLKLAVAEDILSSFWTEVTDGLFDSTQSEKCFLGYEMLKLALPMATSCKMVSQLLSPSFRGVFIKASFGHHSPLHAASMQMADFLVKFAARSSDSLIQSSILDVFVKCPGTIHYDQLTKTKLLASLVSQLQTTALLTYSDHLKRIFLGNSESKTAEDDVRASAVRQMSGLITHPALALETAWRQDLLCFLVFHSYFQVQDSNVTDSQDCYVSKPPSPSSRSVCQSSLMKAVENSYRLPERKGTKSRLGLHFEILTFLAQHIQMLLDREDVKLVSPTLEIKELWKKILKKVHKLAKKQMTGKENEILTFQNLYLHLGLQLFADPVRCREVFEELHECSKRAITGFKKSRNDAAGDVSEGRDGGEADADEPHWTEVVVDLMLSLLSEPSRSTRTFVAACFPLLCPSVTSQGLRHILNVIVPEKASEDDGPLMEEGDEIEDIETGSSSEDGNRENDEEMPNVDDFFRKKIEAALGKAVDNSDADSETYLSDSEMFKLDDAIAEAFRSRAPSNAKRSAKDEETLLHFRMRCMDLITIYLKSEPPLALVLQMILPLVTTVDHGFRHATQTVLADKALNILKVMCKIKKFPHTDDSDTASIVQTLQALTTKAKKVSDPQLGKELCSLCSFLVNCDRRIRMKDSNSQQAGASARPASPDITAIYREALESYMQDSSSQLHPQMFLSFMSIHPHSAWELAILLQKYVFDKKIRLFKRSQGLAVVVAAVGHSKNNPAISDRQWTQMYESIVPGALQDLAAMEQALKPMHATELLRLLSSILLVQIKKSGKVPLANGDELLATLKSFTARQRRRFHRKGQALWNKLVKLLGGNLPDGQCQNSSRKRKSAGSHKLEEDSQTKRALLDNS